MSSSPVRKTLKRQASVRKTNTSRKAVSSKVEKIEKSNSWSSKLAAGLSLALLVFAISPAAVNATGSGAIWTTTGSCGQPQNENHYQVGDTVYINGDNFASGVYSWIIKETSANGNKLASDQVTIDNSGAFCVAALLLTTDDIGGPYQVKVNDVKGDNFSVVAGSSDTTATLTLAKTITNDNGGTAHATDWTLTATGPTNISGTTGSNTVTNATVAAGLYTLSETGGPSGYTNGIYSCIVNSNAAVSSDSLTLAAGDVAICTVNNDDNAPINQSATLIVKKVIVGNNAASPSDFSFVVNSASGSTKFEADGENDLTVNLGTYNVVETAAANYTTIYDNCSNIDLSVDGSTATCTITNTYVAPSQSATLVVKKSIVGNNQASPSDFSFSVGAGSGTTQFDPSGTNTITVNLGTYTVTETSAANYTATYANDANSNTNCDNLDLTVAGTTVTCTITNTYNPPVPTTGSITVVKNTTGADGTFTFSVTGQSDFDITTSGNSGSHTLSGLAAGDYTVSEANSLASGWTFDSADCQDSSEHTVGSISANVASFTLNAGDDITCTFNNIFMSGGGGGSTPTQYTLTITKSGDGDGTVSGAAADNESSIFCNLNECKASDEKTLFSQTYDAGTVVNLTVAPDSESNFDGTWSTTLGDPGTCTGAATSCSLTMNGNVTLNAHFGLNTTPTTTGGGGGGGGPAPTGVVLGITTPAPTPTVTPVFPGKVLGASTSLPRTGLPAWMVLLAILLSTGLVYGPKSIKSLKPIKSESR